ncbi:MAG: hypothetical protein HUU19_07665 [Phycisphaerales bacterium]|nr:hypothetical protein [Phycisphaerales bacterium]
MNMMNRTNNTNNTTRSNARLAGLCVAAALHAITPIALAQPVVQALLPGYKKLETRQATREAALAKLGGNAVEWGRWMAVGPLDHPKGGKDIATAYEPEELLAAMREDKDVSLEREFKGKGGKPIAFTEVSPDHYLKAGDPSAIDLEKFAGGPKEKAVAYLYRRAVVDRAIDVPIAMGSDDGVRLWLNGELVVDVNAERPMSPDSEHATLKLRKGINHLLFKVSQGAGEWTLAFSQGFEMRPQVEAALDFALDRDFPSAEQNYYKLSTVPAVTRGVDGRDLPIVAEVGGIDMYPPSRQGGKQRVILTTRRGEAWLVDGVFANPPLDPKWTLFAGGLQEPLGAAVRPAQGREGVDVFCAQRGELTRLSDTNGDGVADVFDTYCAAWQISGNYHEYAFGPKFDNAGNAWVTLNLAHTGDDGTVMGAPVPTRGWAVRIAPDGTMTKAADGLRSPDGIGIYSDGEMFYTDNQGDYVGTCKLSHLKMNSFHGHQSMLKFREGYGPNWRKDGKPVPEITMPAVWFPYTKMGQSASDVVLDTTAGKFGPFAGQLFVGDQTNATVMRVDLQKVKNAKGDEIYQGACFPFREGLASGVHRMVFAADGSMFVGMTDRGWGSVGAKRYGLQRLSWSGVAPFGVLRMTPTADGFVFEFTRDLPDDCTDAARLKEYKAISYTYEYRPEYGSPEIDKKEHAIAGVQRLDARRLVVMIGALRTGAMGYVHEFTLPALESKPDEKGESHPLLHTKAYYTLHVAPGE